MKNYLKYFLIITIFGCKSIEQPKLTFNEKELLKNIKLECTCDSVERFFSDTYLRYNKEGDYIIRITSKDSMNLKKIELEINNFAKYIDSAILSNNKLITEIDFHLIHIFDNNSNENAKYIRFKRDSSGLFKINSFNY